MLGVWVKRVPVFTEKTGGRARKERGREDRVGGGGETGRQEIEE